MGKDIIYQLEKVAKENNNQGMLARYLLDYQGEIKDLKIRKICDEIFVSIATATRLAKRLNLSGFNELKIYLQEERSAEQHAMNHSRDLSFDEYYQDITESLSKTIYSIDPNMIQGISEQINQCNKIDFYGVGGTNVTLQDFAYKLARLNKQVSVYGDTHLQHVQACNSNHDSIAFALSYSGQTKDVINKLELAKERGAHTILMTSNKYLKHAFIDEIILVNAKDMSRRTFSITSRIASLAILDLLYLKILDLDHEKYREILNETRLEK